MKTIKSDGVYVQKNCLETLEIINITHEIRKSMNIFYSNLDKAKGDSWTRR